MNSTNHTISKHTLSNHTLSNHTTCIICNMLVHINKNHTCRNNFKNNYILSIKQSNIKYD